MNVHDSYKYFKNFMITKHCLNIDDGHYSNIISPLLTLDGDVVAQSARAQGIRTWVRFLPRMINDSLSNV